MDRTDPRRLDDHVLFGPLSLWSLFWYCVRLTANDVPYIICKNPWSVAVHPRWLKEAWRLAPKKLTRGVSKKDQGAE